MVKLDKNDIIRIRQQFNTGLYTHGEIAKQYNVTRGHITKIINHKRWNKFYINGKAEEQYKK
jgi:hypothetical protein